MNSRWISLKNRMKNKEKNNEIRNQINSNNQINNNRNLLNKPQEDKSVQLIVTKNNGIKKDFSEEDDYNYKIYNKPISKYKIFTEEEEYYYNTISTFYSFELKRKYKLLLNKINRFNTNNQDMDCIDFNSDLNLSFQARIKKNIFVKKKIKRIDKNNIFLNKIISIFNKNNKINNKKYNKKNKIKCKYTIKNNKKWVAIHQKMMILKK